jgi:4-alpha-glucanotransferase
VTVGAPPDVFTTLGQDWGLAALSPRALAGMGAERFRQMASSAMRRGGALRLDHAMALRQLFLVPEGLTPEDGAYVRYPFEMLVSELAAQSNRHETVVIGEDLGVVPPGFRDDMQDAGILSYRILYFEQDDDGFLASDAYPELALACLSTHDLPTLLGWWQGDDIALRLEYGLIDAHAARAQRTRRGVERRSLLDRIGVDGAAVGDHGVAVAAHGFVARTPCLLAAARLADLVGERHPTNLPGIADAYPNWRRRLPVPVEALEQTALWRDVTAEFAAHRGRRP